MTAEQVRKDIDEKKIVLPLPHPNRGFAVIPGLHAPNGKTGPENEVFKSPSYLDTGYSYWYTDVQNRRIKVKIEIEEKDEHKA